MSFDIIDTLMDGWNGRIFFSGAQALKCISHFTFHFSLFTFTFFQSAYISMKMVWPCTMKVMGHSHYMLLIAIILSCLMGSVYCLPIVWWNYWNIFYVAVILLSNEKPSLFAASLAPDVSKWALKLVDLKYSNV